MEYAYVCNKLHIAETFDTPSHNTATNQNQNQTEATPLTKAFRKAKRSLGFVAVILFALVLFLIPITLWMLSIYLAYNCYRGHTTQQVFGVITALFFPVIYLLFYLVVHIMLGYACASASSK